MIQIQKFYEFLLNFDKKKMRNDFWQLFCLLFNKSLLYSIEQSTNAVRFIVFHLRKIIFATFFIPPVYKIIIFELFSLNTHQYLHLIYLCKSQCSCDNKLYLLQRWDTLVQVIQSININFLQINTLEIITFSAFRS